MMIDRKGLERLDDLIAALQAMRSEMGNCEVAIDDADTQWHLQIAEVRRSRRRHDRLLIRGGYDARLATMKAEAHAGNDPQPPLALPKNGGLPKSVGLCPKNSYCDNVVAIGRPNLSPLESASDLQYEVYGVDDQVSTSGTAFALDKGCTISAEDRLEASMVLDRELEAYERELPKLLANEGRFVLIHSGGVAGIFDTYEDAVQAGYERFELSPFLVKKIQSVEQVQYITRDVEACRT